MCPCNYHRYPPNWKTEIVPRILARAKNRCEECGLPNKMIVYSVPIKRNGKIKRVWGEYYPGVESIKGTKKVQVVLTVAHLDHDEDNWDVKDERLKGLCQYCHLKLDREEHIRRKKSERKN